MNYQVQMNWTLVLSTLQFILSNPSLVPNAGKTSLPIAGNHHLFLLRIIYLTRPVSSVPFHSTISLVSTESPQENRKTKISKIEGIRPIGVIEWNRYNLKWFER